MAIRLFFSLTVMYMGGISSDENYSGSSASLGYAGLAAVKAEVGETTDQLTVIDLGMRSRALL